MVAERGNGETTVLRPWVLRWILGCLFAVVSAVAHYTAELTEGRELVGLTGSVWSFLPTAGFVVALVSLPRISQTTARPYYVATTVVAVLSLWPLILVVFWPSIFVVRSPVIQLAVWTVLYTLTPTLLFAGAVTVLLASGILERARISKSDHAGSSPPVNSHGPEP